jgi:ligand-binding sensor domain-containing protein
MWVGGYHSDEGIGGITRWDIQNGNWIYFEARYLSQLNSDEVNAIAVNDSDVWFGTRQGLGRYNKKNGTWRNYTVYDNLWNDDVRTVAISDSVVWIGTSWGINRIQLPGMVIEQIRDEKLIRRHIFRLVVDGEDVWAGTDRGLYRYSGKQGIWEYVPGYPGMLIKNVTAISVFEDEIWFGTDGGVQAYDKLKKEWTGYPVDHYLIDRSINCILADNVAVWVGTDNGVLKYHKEEKRWRRFTTNDGLVDNAVNWILLDGDYVWFGTDKGLTRFFWNAPYRID